MPVAHFFARIIVGKDFVPLRPFISRGRRIREKATPRDCGVVCRTLDYLMGVVPRTRRVQLMTTGRCQRQSRENLFSSFIHKYIYVYINIPRNRALILTYFPSTEYSRRAAQWNDVIHHGTVFMDYSC